MKKIIFLLLIVFASNQGYSQIEILDESGSWFTMTNKFKISEKFYVGDFIQLRRVSFLKNTQSILIGPSINYKINDNITLTAGYYLFRTYPYGVRHAAIKRNENNFYQQLTINSKAGKLSFSNRFRFEERFREVIDFSSGTPTINGKIYAQRARYRLSASFNLVQLKNGKSILAKISNETRIRFKQGLSQPDFDQNNLYGFLGYKLADNSKIWLGYGLNYLKVNSALFVSNKIAHLAFSYDFDFTKK